MKPWVVPGVVGYACITCTREAEARGLRVQGQHGRPHLKKPKHSGQKSKVRKGAQGQAGMNEAGDQLWVALGGRQPDQRDFELQGLPPVWYLGMLTPGLILPGRPFAFPAWRLHLGKFHCMFKFLLTCRERLKELFTQPHKAGTQ
jgi:hypothetical protein